MNRFSAFAIHMLISLVVFAILGYLILFHWYPDFFFETDGGWQGIRIITIVDLVLGPTLTLIVFKSGKPGLKTDLTIIAAIQIISLIAGIYLVYTERPIAMVYADGFFHSMSADDYRDSNQLLPDLSDFPGPPPKMVSVSLPPELDKQLQIRGDAYRSDIPLRAMSIYYKPFELGDIDFERDVLPLSEVIDFEDNRTLINDFVSRSGGSLAHYAFFQFGSRYKQALLGMHRESGRFVGILELPLQDEIATDSAEE